VGLFALFLEEVMKDFSIVRVSMLTISTEMLTSWADLYCEIWKEPPWNEDFWKVSDVIADFRKEMCNPHTEAFLALDGNRVVGFTHGYSVGSQEMREIAGSDLLDGLFKNIEHVYYVDELGVAKAYRGRHISIDLTYSLIRAAQAQGLTCITLRTDKLAGAARGLYEKLMFKELEVCDVAYPNRTYWKLEL
jgi:ribosomal protein S18 acetylase RimI-like enzyme